MYKTDTDIIIKFFSKFREDFLVGRKQTWLWPKEFLPFKVESCFPYLQTIRATDVIAFFLASWEILNFFTHSDCIDTFFERQFLRLTFVILTFHSYFNLVIWLEYNICCILKGPRLGEVLSPVTKTKGKFLFFMLYKKN